MIRDACAAHSKDKTKCTSDSNCNWILTYYVIAKGKIHDCDANPQTIVDDTLTGKTANDCNVACSLESDCYQFGLGKVGGANEGKCILWTQNCGKQQEDATYDIYQSSAKTNPSTDFHVCTHKQKYSILAENKDTRDACKTKSTNTDCDQSTACLYTPPYKVKFYRAMCKEKESLIGNEEDKTVETCDQACIAEE